MDDGIFYDIDWYKDLMYLFLIVLEILNKLLKYVLQNTHSVYHFLK